MKNGIIGYLLGSIITYGSVSALIGILMWLYPQAFCSLMDGILGS